MTLAFWGDVTTSVTIPLDSRHAVSYRWPIITIRIGQNNNDWTDNNDNKSQICIVPLGRDLEALAAGRQFEKKNRIYMQRKLGLVHIFVTILYTFVIYYTRWGINFVAPMKSVTDVTHRLSHIVSNTHRRQRDQISTSAGNKGCHLFRQLCLVKV